jgi:predicted nucleotidyltransferase
MPTFQKKIPVNISKKFPANISKKKSRQHFKKISRQHFKKKSRQHFKKKFPPTFQKLFHDFEPMIRMTTLQTDLGLLKPPTSRPAAARKTIHQKLVEEDVVSLSMSHSVTPLLVSTLFCEVKRGFVDSRKIVPLK